MGRKPKYDKAMSSAEKVREYRLRKKTEGQKQITLTFSESTIDKIDELIEYFELPNRAEAIQQLIKLQLVEALEAMAGGKSADEYEELANSNDIEVKELISHIKKITWQSICLKEPSLMESMHDSIQRSLGDADGR